ncbi:MAG: hypothetical protein KDK70_14110 [Myxococcales bacterium]|nr:hypothetical protein [Myxococcales bacterium]
MLLVRLAGLAGLAGLVGLAAGCPAPQQTSDTGDGPADEDGTTSLGPGQTATSGVGGDRGEAGSSADDDTSSSFLVPPDGGVVGQCDPYEQDCPRGEKCTSYVATPGQETVDSTKCVPIIGEDLWGEPCERMADNDTCAPGYFCMTDVSGHTGTGTCLEYCSPEVPCENGGDCFPFNDGALPLCEVTCDPLLQDCPVGQGCYAAFDGFLCAQPGAPEGLGNDGDPCSTVQSCNPGLICRTGTAGCPMDGACCTPICELGVDDCSDPAEDCVPALEDPPPGLVDVGYCGIPA